jgi:hypothetical protein
MTLTDITTQRQHKNGTVCFLDTQNPKVRYMSYKSGYIHREHREVKHYLNIIGRCYTRILRYPINLHGSDFNPATGRNITRVLVRDEKKRIAFIKSYHEKRSNKEKC